MTTNDHPRVFFRMPGEKDNHVGYGYLSIIDGVPWMAATLEEAKSRIPATMIRLDPRLLEEEPNSDGVERAFRYRGPLRAPG